MMNINIKKIKRIFTGFICCMSLLFSELSMAQEVMGSDTSNKGTLHSLATSPAGRIIEGVTGFGLSTLGIAFLDASMNARAFNTGADKRAIEKYGEPKVTTALEDFRKGRELTAEQKSILREIEVPRKSMFTGATVKGAKRAAGIFIAITILELVTDAWSEGAESNNLYDYTTKINQMKFRQVNEIEDFIEGQKEFEDLTQKTQEMIKFNSIYDYLRLKSILKLMSISGENQDENIPVGLQVLAIAKVGFNDIQVSEYKNYYIDSFRSVTSKYLKVIKEGIDTNKDIKDLVTEDGKKIEDVDIDEVIKEVRTLYYDKIITSFITKSGDKKLEEYFKNNLNPKKDMLDFLYGNLVDLENKNNDFIKIKSEELFDDLMDKIDELEDENSLKNLIRAKDKVISSTKKVLYKSSLKMATENNYEQDIEKTYYKKLGTVLIGSSKSKEVVTIQNYNKFIDSLFNDNTSEISD